MIYVWASGNGGRKKDHCNCDGYVSSIYTLTVGSLTQHGNVPWFSEPCASILTATFSSGEFNEAKLVSVLVLSVIHVKAVYAGSFVTYTICNVGARDLFTFVLFCAMPR